MDEWNLEELGPPPPYEEVATPLTLPKLYPSRTAGKPRTSTVTKDQCAAHLKLLAVLAGLRRTVSSQDGLFGLWDIDAMSAAQANRPNLLARIKEKRWAVYTSRAVDRYWRWWLKCVPNSSPRPKVSALRNKSYLNVTRAPPISLDRDFMPPLGGLSNNFIRMMGLLNNKQLTRNRRVDGVAFPYAQSQSLSRRLYSIWEAVLLGHRIPAYYH